MAILHGAADLVKARGLVEAASFRAGARWLRATHPFLADYNTGYLTPESTTRARPPHPGPASTAMSGGRLAPGSALRMLMNNLDPDVAERPSELVVYGGIGRAARGTGKVSTASSPRCASSEGDQTLLVQSASRSECFRTHADAPRVLIANSNLVPHWATLDHFNALDRRG